MSSISNIRQGRPQRPGRLVRRNASTNPYELHLRPRTWALNGSSTPRSFNQRLSEIQARPIECPVAQIELEMQNLYLQQHQQQQQQQTQTQAGEPRPLMVSTNDSIGWFLPTMGMDYNQAQGSDNNEAGSPNTASAYADENWDLNATRLQTIQAETENVQSELNAIQSESEANTVRTDSENPQHEPVEFSSETATGTETVQSDTQDIQH